MLKYGLAGLLMLAAGAAFGQAPAFTPRVLRLPPELANPGNQFSGLVVHDAQLFLLSESRLQEKAPAQLYTIPLASLDRQLRDSTQTLPYRRYALQNLEALRHRINAAGEVYEGLEALSITGREAYFSVETTTASQNGYLLRGQLRDTVVVMDPDFLVAIRKPTQPDGAHIYNAGFEAILERGRYLYAFFEYNSFPGQNSAYRIDKRQPNAAPKLLPLQKLPFRITDVTATGRRRFTAINYFFRGPDDSIYRLPETEAESRLIQTNGTYRSYCRLLDVKLSGNGFRWKPLAEFPAQYMAYNWEGIAAYRGGYFILNDTYTPQKPYSSVLLYFEKTR